MSSPPLLARAENVHSQNGEDGIIVAIFEVIGEGARRCCEFGAWDGIHFSNTRSLVLRGWSSAFIEADPQRFEQLVATYRDTPAVTAIHGFVDTGANRLDRLLERHGFPRELDFLSVDIDGLDYTSWKTLPLRPRVVCIEVSAGHDPEIRAPLPQAVEARIGQPLGTFVELGRQLGYRLVAYTGNAFFVRDDEGHIEELPELTPEVAYEQNMARMPKPERAWLYRVNLGLAPPYRRFRNPRLSRRALALSKTDALRAGVRGVISLARVLRGGYGVPRR